MHTWKTWSSGGTILNKGIVTLLTTNMALGRKVKGKIHLVVKGKREHIPFRPTWKK